MTTLARRYRRWLSLYPASYRAAHEEELLSTLLDASPPGARWPAPREVWSIVLNAIDARYGAATGRVLTSTAMQAFELMCLLLLAAQGLAFFHGLAMRVEGEQSPQALWMAAQGGMAILAIVASLLPARRTVAAGVAVVACGLIIVEASVRAYVTPMSALVPVLMAWSVAGKTHYRSLLPIAIYLAFGCAEVFLPEAPVMALSGVVVSSTFIAACYDPRIFAALAMGATWCFVFALASPQPPRFHAVPAALCMFCFCGCAVTWRRTRRAIP